MSKFHSTITRRNFMKGLGLAGAGLGAAAAAAPVFHDLDEVAASPNGGLLHPWWVKERNYLDPVAETDWSILKAWDWNYGPNKDVHTGFRTFPIPLNAADTTLWEADAAAKAKNAEQINSVRKSAAKNSGWELKDLALRTGCALRPHLERTDGMGYSVNTPEDRGLSKWTGTADENASLIRSGLHFMGIPNVGFLEIDEKVKKMFYPTKVRFEDTPGEPYIDNDGLYVIPSNLKYLIVGVVRKEEDYLRYFAYPTRPYGYDFRYILGLRVQKFIKSLGYHSLFANGYFGGAMNVPLGVLAGNNELGRIAHSVHPSYGTRIVCNDIWVTDLPVPATNPIDAGIFRFCKTCKKCSDACQEFGSDILSKEDEPTWETTGPWNRTGVKSYSINWRAEQGCTMCAVSCVFNHTNLATIHDVVGATLANTTIFNGFFANMDDVFYKGYSLDPPTARMNEWWDRDLRTYPFDVIQSGENRR